MWLFQQYGSENLTQHPDKTPTTDSKKPCVKICQATPEGGIRCRPSSIFIGQPDNRDGKHDRQDGHNHNHRNDILRNIFTNTLNHDETPFVRKRMNELCTQIDLVAIDTSSEEVSMCDRCRLV